MKLEDSDILILAGVTTWMENQNDCVSESLVFFNAAITHDGSYKFDLSTDDVSAS